MSPRTPEESLRGVEHFVRETVLACSTHIRITLARSRTSPGMERLRREMENGSTKSIYSAIRYAQPAHSPTSIAYPFVTPDPPKIKDPELIAHELSMWCYYMLRVFNTTYNSAYLWAGAKFPRSFTRVPFPTRTSSSESEVCRMLAFFEVLRFSNEYT